MGEVDKQNRRLVKVGKSHVEECKKLLGLMGVPYVQAPCEAEAQCAELVKSGKVYAVGTEDMDALTFGSKVLLRHLTMSEARKMPIKEFYYDKIRGIGPKNAIKLIQEHKSIEKILENIDTKKFVVPENWVYEGARNLFIEPEVTPASEIELKWEKPDEEGLVKFMAEENGFAEDRIRNGAKKLLKAKQGTTQGRLDSFFKVLPSTPNIKVETKRKGDEKTNGSGKKTKVASNAA